MVNRKSHVPKSPEERGAYGRDVGIEPTVVVPQSKSDEDTRSNAAPTGEKVSVGLKRPRPIKREIEDFLRSNTREFIFMCLVTVVGYLWLQVFGINREVGVLAEKTVGYDKVVVKVEGMNEAVTVLKTRLEVLEGYGLQTRRNGPVLKQDRQP